MNRKKKLAICIPTWNRCELLKEAVESVLPQLTSDCTLIVFDNASTDSTQAYLATLSDRLSVIRHPENVGYFGNFTACLHQFPHYDWIAVLHSDDLYTPQAVASILKAVAQYPTAGIIFSKQHQIDVNGTLFLRAAVLQDAIEYHQGHDAVRLCQGQIACSSTVFNSLAIANAGDPTASFQYSADEEYNARIATRWNLVELPTILSCYRRHEAHTMRETWRQKDFINSYMEMRQKINDYCLPADRLSSKQVQWEVSRMLLGHCAYLDAVGDMDTADRFYRNAFATSPSLFLSNWRIVLRWLLHKTPILNQWLARRLSKNFSFVESKQIADDV